MSLTMRVAVSLLAITLSGGLVACTNDEPSKPETSNTGSQPPSDSANHSDGHEVTPGQGETKPISREDWLAGKWLGEGDPPEPLPVIRLVTPEEDLKVHTTCMEEAGFPNESPRADEYWATIPEGQEQVYYETDFQCTAQYPLAPKYYQRYNQKQLDALYEYQTGPMTACLTEHNWAPEPAPSREKFIADYVGDISPRWFPYGNVPENEQRSAERECPMTPEGFFDLATVS